MMFNLNLSAPPRPNLVVTYGDPEPMAWAAFTVRDSDSIKAALDDMVRDLKDWGPTEEADIRLYAQYGEEGFLSNDAEPQVGYALEYLIDEMKFHGLVL